jgi:hypothetical protein
MATGRGKALKNSTATLTPLGTLIYLFTAINYANSSNVIFIQIRPNSTKLAEK